MFVSFLSFSISFFPTFALALLEGVNWVMWGNVGLGLKGGESDGVAERRVEDLGVS